MLTGFNNALTRGARLYIAGGAICAFCDCFFGGFERPGRGPFAIIRITVDAPGVTESRRETRAARIYDPLYFRVNGLFFVYFSYNSGLTSIQDNHIHHITRLFA